MPEINHEPVSRKSVNAQIKISMRETKPSGKKCNFFIK